MTEDEAAGTGDAAPRDDRATTPADRGGPASWRFGSQAWPFQRHSLSGETAAFHCMPSHHQKPSGENMVCGRGGGPAVGGSAPIS